MPVAQAPAAEALPRGSEAERSRVSLRKLSLHLEVFHGLGRRRSVHRGTGDLLDDGNLRHGDVGASRYTGRASRCARGCSSRSRDGGTDNFYLDDLWMPIYVVVRLLVRRLVVSAVPRLRISRSRAAPVDDFIARANPRVTFRRRVPSTRNHRSRPGDPAANARGRTDGSESAPDIAPVHSFPESFLNVRHRPRDRHVPAPEAREIRLAGAYARRADPFPVRAVGVATPPSSRAVGPFDNRGNAGDGNIPTALPRNARFRVPATKRPPQTPLPVPLVRAARTLPLTHRAPSPPVRERRRVHSPRSTRPR